MTIIEKIKIHEEDIFSGKISVFKKICPKCDGIPGTFKIHEYKSRIFLVIDECLIKKQDATLARLKCPICKSSFTYYPDFALPYKRYVKDNILELSQEYVENDKTSYKDIVNKDKTPIAYEDAESSINESVFSRSTVWRWISFIGSLNTLLSNTLKLIRQKSSTSPIFRKIYIPHPKKYRNDRRKLVLQKSMRLLDAVSEFRSLFKISIFPDFATVHNLN